MAEEGKRIIELDKRTTGYKSGSLAVHNPTSDDTEQATQQEMLGADRADMDWQADISYSIGDFVLYLGLCWESLQGSNVSNIPTENAWWTAATISEADGITDTSWAAGIFTYDKSKVVYNNIQYYLQTAAPFESSDIAAEILSGDWATGIETVGTLITEVNAATYTVSANDLILHVTYTATGAVTITVPTSMITAGFKELLIKDAGFNASVNNITIIGEAGQLIDGDANQIINSDKSAVHLYAENNQLFIY